MAVLKPAYIIIRQRETFDNFLHDILLGQDILFCVIRYFENWLVHFSLSWNTHDFE